MNVIFFHFSNIFLITLSSLYYFSYFLSFFFFKITIISFSFFCASFFLFFIQNFLSFIICFFPSFYLFHILSPFASHTTFTHLSFFFSYHFLTLVCSALMTRPLCFSNICANSSRWHPHLLKKLQSRNICY